MTWLARLSLTNRAIVGLVTVLVVVFGAISTTSLRQELLPSIDIPVAVVATEYPGASPEVVEQQVTAPIEVAVGSVAGVTGTRSTSTGGSSVITVDLQYGSDLTDVTSQIQRAVQGVTLPADVAPQVITGGTDNIPVMQLGVSSNLGDDRVATVLRDDVHPLLAGLDGVADVTLSGIREPQITVDVDAAAAAERGVSLSSVLTVLKANGVRVSAGQLTPDTEPVTVEVGSPITSVEQLRDLYITPDAVAGVAPSAPPAAAPPAAGTGTASAPAASTPGVTRNPPNTAGPVRRPTNTSGTAQPLASTPITTPRPASTPSATPSPTSTPTATPSPTSTPNPTPCPHRHHRQCTPGTALTDTSGSKRFWVRLSAASTAQPPTGDAGAVPVRLGDIATIAAEVATVTGYTRINGVPSIGVEVTKKKQANAVAVSDEIRHTLPRITELLGGSAHNAQITVVLDQAPFIQQSIDDLTTEGLLGLAFAVLVILGFLMSVRATLVTAVSVPLSVLIAMIVLDLGGYTLNILTLGAFTVATGRVVDDSIVVIENIKRHIGYGGSRRTAIVTAVGEVAGAITASTLTTVAVFAPIGLVGGQVGELFRPFAITVTAALLASLLVSLTVVPALASVALRSATTLRPSSPRDAPPRPADRGGDEVGGSPSERTALQRGYLPVLQAALRRPLLSLVAAVAILLGTAALAPQLGTNFLGEQGGDTLSVSQELAPGTGLPQADAAAKRIEAVLAKTSGIATYQVTVGPPAGASAFGPPGSTSDTTRFSVTLDDGANATAVSDDLRARFGTLGGRDQVGRLTVQGGGGGNDQLVVVVRAQDPAALANAADRVQQAIASIPEATDVRNNLVAAQPIAQVAVDRREAAQAGLTEAQIGQSVSTALRGSTAGTLAIDGVQQRVLVRAGTAPADLEALRALPLPTASGTVPLSDVATVTESTTPPSISHTDGSRSAQITARPAADDLGAVTASLQGRLDELALPAGATAEIGGISAEQGEAFAQLGLALLGAIAMVYLVMVVAFRSLLQPLVLLIAIPFAATGALGLLLLTGTPLGVPALIGMLMLVGIVVTNAIVLIDRVNQYRRSGRPVLNAVVEGSAQRLRPILMTAVATVFALLPMALGLTGGGAFISQPLAIVVIGGLISSTLLTLVLVPVLYVLTARGRKRRPEGGGDDGPAAGPDLPPGPRGGPATEPLSKAADTAVGAPVPDADGGDPRSRVWQPPRTTRRSVEPHGRTVG
ncbi:MAG: efflux RND transporter permease subunit [Pseudonocardiaceae bacterium]